MEVREAQADDITGEDFAWTLCRSGLCREEHRMASASIRIGLIGDRGETIVAHRAIPHVLELAAVSVPSAFGRGAG